MSWSTSEIRVRLVPPNMSKPSSNFLTDYSKAVLLLWILFVFRVCLCHAIFSDPCSLVVTCLKRADPLALLCVIFSCVLSLSDMVSWARCGIKNCDQLTETGRVRQSTVIHCQIRLFYSKMGIFDFTTAGDWDCVAAVERLPALHHSVDFIFLSFGIMDFIVEL